MKNIGWGVIGSGQIATDFASDLELVEGAHLRGFASRNQKDVADLAARFGAISFDSIEDLLSSDVDVIYVATPHSSHKEFSIAALEAGKAVLCEKPFTINFAEALAVVQLAEKKQLFLMEGMWTRFIPAMKEIFQIVKSGKIGELVSLETSFGYDTSHIPTSRAFNKTLGGGGLLDVGVYGVSLAHQLFQSPAKTIESKAKIGFRSGVDVKANWSIEFENGGKAVGSSAIIQYLKNEALVVGTKGSIRVPQFWSPQGYFLNDVEHFCKFEGVGLRFEAEEVTKCLLEGRTESEIMPHSDSLAVMKSLDQIRAPWKLKYPCETPSKSWDIWRSIFAPRDQ